jgi:cyclohexanone monooxygenase
MMLTFTDNNEGTPSMKAAQGAAYGGGSPAFFKIINEWREKDDFAGLDVRSFEN